MEGIAGAAQRRRMPHLVVSVAVIALLLATPVATWFHVGPLGTAERSGSTANVLWRAESVDEVLETACGRVATATVPVAITVLLVAAGLGSVDPGGVWVLLPLVLLGAFCGAYGRVLTMTTPGCDIGSTLLGILIGLPVAYLVIESLMIWAVVASLPW
jgi:hypothetical protein